MQRRSQIALQGSRTNDGVSHEPIEAKRLVVVLVDLRKSGLHQDLRRNDVQQFDRHLNDVQILQRGAHEEESIAVVEENLRRIRAVGHAKVHHARRQKILPDLIVGQRSQIGGGNTEQTAATTAAAAATAAALTLAGDRDPRDGEPAAAALLAAALLAAAAQTATLLTTTTLLAATLLATSSTTRTRHGLNWIGHDALQALHESIRVDLEHA